MPASKDERLQLRVDAMSKQQLEIAASTSHLSLSAFVLQAARDRAAEVMADRALVALDEESADAFLAALEAPSRVNDQLLDALQRPVKVDWLD